MARDILKDKNLRKSIVLYFVLFLILVLGLVCYAKFLPRNSFGADSLTMNLQANIEKYINYKISDDDKGSLLQVGVKSGIQYNDENDQYIPVKQSQIKLEFSKIDNKYPFKVNVIAKSTEATNGKTEDIKEDYRYDEQSGILIINTSNLNENGELINREKTSNNPVDEYMVICYYDTYTEDSNQREIEINGKATALLSEDDRILNKQEIFRGEVKENIGELTSIEYHTDEIANGYIKSNIINGTNYDTEYTEKQNIVVSKKESQDKILILENNSFVKNENGEIKRDLGNNNELIYKNTVFYKNNLIDLLGEEGKLELFDNEQNKITEINKNSQFNEDGTIAVNYENDLTSLIIKTSKIKNEGILKIKNTKLIKNTMHNVENMDIKTTANINLVKEEVSNDSETLQDNNVTEKVIYRAQKENIVEIKDATTNIDVNTSKINWTNKEQNEVDFDINLKSISMKDNMFKNPKIQIQLPEEVEKVILGESHMVYGDQLNLENVTLEKDENGIYSIIISVDGTQDKYYSNNLELLPNIKIPAIIILKKDIEKNSSNINVKYINEFTIDRNYEEKEYSKEISIENYREENITTNNNNNNIQSPRRLTRTVNVTSQEGSNNSSNIKTEVAMYKGNRKIEENDVLYEGEYIKYNLSVSNISGEDIDNVKVIGAIPEGTIYGELRADYNNYMGEYKYIFDESILSKEFNIGTLKAGGNYNVSYEVKIKDLEENVQNIQLRTSVDTYISDNKVNSVNYTNTVEKAEAKVFLGAFLDNTEDRWNYSLKVESTEDKQVEVKVQFPKEFNLELRVQAGGQDGTNEPVNLETDSNNIVTDTIETNKEYWYEGEIDSTLIEKSIDNKPVVLYAYATARINDKEYNSNENRINYESRDVSVIMTSNNEGEEVYPSEEINYEILVKNIGKTNLNQGNTDAFSVDIKDYLPDEVNPISVEYEYWEQVDENWVKKNTTKDIKNIYTDEQGNKEPNVDLTITIPYNQEVKIKIKTVADSVIQKTKIENNAIVTGTYIKAKRSNTISHTVLPTVIREVTQITEEYDNNGEGYTSNNTEDSGGSNNKNYQNSESKFISGVAWLDENNDGERQESEQRIGGVETLLIDVNDQSKIAGKTTTSEDGSYKFSNLNSEKYIIVFKYDNQNYTVTQYKKAEVSDNVNSDVNNKEIKINGETIKAGVTDILTLNNSQENIDIGLIKTEICDFKLDKYISKATVTTAKSTKQYSYNNQKLAKVEIKSKEIEGANVEVEYKIVVTNEGEVVASPSKIIDYLPEGFEFTKEINENWAIQKNGQLINTSLSNKKLNPGESCELTLVLTKRMSSNATGQYKNAAEIGEISNTIELQDNDSTPGNNKEGEDDYSEATIIISIGTGGIIYIGIIITLICALICTLIILNKKGKLKNKNILKLTKLSIFVVIFAGILFAGDNTSWSDGQVKRQLAYQQLQFYWDPYNTEYTNAYGSTYFESLIKLNGKPIGAVCQNAGLAAHSGQYTFQKATGLESSTTTDSGNATISIRKTNDTTGVNINEIKENGKTYYIYGPIKFTSTFNPEKIARKNVKYTISSAYSGPKQVTNNNITILYKGLDGNQKASNGSITDDKISADQILDKNNKIIKIYLKIDGDYLHSQNNYRGCLQRFSITATAGSQTVSTTTSRGYLHYKANRKGLYQSIKTINKYPAYEYTTTKTLRASMKETWSIINFNTEIIKTEKDNPNNPLKDVSFCLSTKEKNINKESKTNDDIFYKLPDSITDEKTVVKGYDFRSIAEGKNGEWTKDINKATKFTTDKDGKIVISNLNGMGITYKLVEYQNNNYGYNVIQKELPDRIATSYRSAGDMYAQGNIYKCSISNTKITGNLEINKADEDTNEPLKGITFKIRKKDNNYIRVENQDKIIQSKVEGSFTIGGMEYTENKDEATEFITDDRGKIQLYNILEGEYIVEETGTANYFGYDIDEQDTVKWNTQTEGFKKNIKIESDKENVEVTIFNEEKNEYVVKKEGSNEYEFTENKKTATKFNVGNVPQEGKYILEVNELPCGTYIIEQYKENDKDNYEETIEKSFISENIDITKIKPTFNRFVLKDEVLDKYLKLDDKDVIFGEATIEENNKIEFVDNKNDATKFDNNYIHIINKLSNKFQVEIENDEQYPTDYMVINGTDMYMCGPSRVNYRIRNSNGFIIVLDENDQHMKYVTGNTILEKFMYTSNLEEATIFYNDGGMNGDLPSSVRNLPEERYEIYYEKDGATKRATCEIFNRYIRYEIKVREQSSNIGKEGIKYFISKENEEDDEHDYKYLKIYDENNNFVNNVSETTVGRIEETTDINQASIFKTDSNGNINIERLPIDEYEIQGIYEESETSANISYTISNSDIREKETKSGDGKYIEVKIAKQPSKDTSFANLANITNKKKYIKISGYVFEDIISENDSSRDDLYDENDKKLKGINVKLYKNNGEPLDERITDENGNYKFGDYIEDKTAKKIKIEDLEDAYINFEYNGLHYQTTNIIMKQDETDKVEDNSTKAVENNAGEDGEGKGERRENFNNNFTTIEYNESKNADGNTVNELKYEYEKENHASKLKLGDNVVYGYEGQEYPTSGVDDKYLLTASTYNNIFDQDANISKKRLLGQNLTFDNIHDINIGEITNVNLGLRRREMPDLAISTDINNVEININGFKHIYSGNERLKNRGSYSEEGVEKDTNDIFNATVKAGSKYKKGTSYTRELYEADCSYIGNNPLEVFLTYEIKVRNEATNIKSTLNSIANYYDKNYLTPDSYKIEGSGTIDNTSNTENFDGNYNKLDLNMKDLEIDPQQEISILIKFQLIKFAGITYDAELKKNVAMLNNYTEITSYSTKDSNEKIYAGIDKDSNPGNIISNGKTFEDENELLNEDDNDKAPGIKISFDKARQLEGTVFLDNPTEEKPGGPGKERQGSGIFEQGENTIAGVKVGLYRTSDFDSDGKIKSDAIPQGTTYYTNGNQVTAEDGKFVVTNFIPGNYKLVYIWGNGEYTVEKYKGTIWTDGNRKEKYLNNGDYNGEENKDWYRNNSNIRYTDAKDNWYLKENNNGKMESSTNELRFGVDKNDNIKDKNKDNIYETITNEIDEEFAIPNIDFGIVEKARQSLAISKKIENIKITLANGQTVVDASFDENGKLIGTPKGVNYRPYESKNTPVWISLDSELIQGAKADITYRITLKNNSELDYSSKEYYWYGIIDDDAESIKIKPAGVYDYLDNSMVLNQDSNQINDNDQWQVKTLDEYNKNIKNAEGKKEPTIIEKYLYEQYSSETDTTESIKTIKGYEEFEKLYKDAILHWNENNILKGRKERLENRTILYNEKLENEIGTEEGANSNTVTLKVSKILSNKEDIELKNDTEIVKIVDENGSGSTNIVPIVEELYDKAETVIISTNPGRTDYTIETVQIILVCLIIVAVEIILVKKKIIR